MYPPYPLLSYFSVVVCLRCLLHHILSLIAYAFWENWDFFFIIILQLMMSSNSRMRFGLQIVFVCLYIISSHYHHCANLSEDIELIKCLSDIFVEGVRLNILSQLSIIEYMGLCVFSLPISLVMIEIIYTLSYYHHHQIGSMNYYPLFRVRSLNDGVRCMSLPILIVSLYRVHENRCLGLKIYGLCQTRFSSKYEITICIVFKQGINQTRNSCGAKSWSSGTVEFNSYMPNC